MTENRGSGCGCVIGILVAISVGPIALWLAVLGVIWLAPWLIPLAVGSVTLGLLGGIVVGPARAVISLAKGAPQHARIAELSRPPRGPARHFGWDRAQLTYFPYQARRDAQKVAADLLQLASLPLGLLSARGWLILLALAAVPTSLGWAIGVLGCLAVLVVLLALTGSLAWAGCRIVAAANLAVNRIRTKVGRIATWCPDCYQRLSQPSVICPSCGITHRDISAATFGVFHRHCECGERITTSPLAAARRFTSVCPFCDVVLPDGSGSRPTMILATFGTNGAGKTTLLARLLADTEAGLRTNEGSVRGLSSQAEAFLADSRSELTQIRRTQPQEHPAGLPFQLSVGVAEAELHIHDGSGDSFRDWHCGDELTYFDESPVAIFVLDPLTIPRIHALLETAGPQARGLDPQAAYSAVSDRLRATAIDLTTRTLAVVVTRRDQIVDLTGDHRSTFDDSPAIRSWLEDQEFDGFVRRIEQDFGTVRYFAVDCLAASDGIPLETGPLLTWLASQHGLPRPIIGALGTNDHPAGAR